MLTPGGNELISSSEAHADLLRALGDRPRRVPARLIGVAPDPGAVASELGILKRNTRKIVRAANRDARLNVVELEPATDGAWEALKKGARALDVEATHSSISLRKLDEGLARLPLLTDGNNLTLLLGGKIGRYSPEEQVWLLSRLSRFMKPGDFLLTGFDLNRNPEELPDRRAFCLGALLTLNRRTGAQFDPSLFDYEAKWAPETGAIEHWLISTREQTVPMLGEKIELAQGEGMLMDCDWKFSNREIRKLARVAGFSSTRLFEDRAGSYVLELWSAENVKHLYQN